ncbi:plasmid maintenance protein [Borreliella bavariensis]|uniref:plasmid maintenance protein n=1 Tax=Borreliella bavariensis TaxID=664662 RepID=UPI001C004E56|nr:plasmid maintenance protein [Borreliella bavariensis]
MNPIYIHRLEQDNKIVNNKKYIFRKLHFEILEQNSKKTDPNLKEISDLVLRAYIGKKEIEYQRLLKVSWFLEKKYQEYLKSQKVKTYQIRDIVASVNSMLTKDTYKTIAKRTIEKDLKKLVEMGLVYRFSKSFGKNKGGQSLYKPNSNIWTKRIEILRGCFEGQVREFVKDKRIVTIFKKEIDEYTFPNSIEKNPDNAEQDSAELILHIKDNIKIKNSIEENFFENIEKNFAEKNPKKEKQNLIEKKGVENELKKEKQNLIEKKGVENELKKEKQKKDKKNKLKFSYKESFEQYQENKLTTKYKIPVTFFSALKGHSNTVNTYKNALINLEHYLNYLVAEYRLKDILEFYMVKFKQKYKKKIWFMSSGFNGSDFFTLLGEFKDTYVPIYKQEQIQKPTSEQKIDKGYSIFKGQKAIFKGQKGYFDENGNFCKVEDFVKLSTRFNEFLKNGFRSEEKE